MRILSKTRVRRKLRRNMRQQDLKKRPMSVAGFMFSCVAVAFGVVCVWGWFSCGC